MTEKSVLWWASVGGAKCEPIRVKGNEWFSIGCGDPHPMTDAVELVEPIAIDDIPLTKKEEKAQERAWRRDQAKLAACHYRRFD